jgi:hypothetical protein
MGGAAGAPRRWRRLGAPARGAAVAAAATAAAAAAAAGGPRGAAAACLYVSDNTEYDLSPLAATPFFTYSEAAQSFRFALCADVAGTTCGGGAPSSSFAFSANIPCFKSYGRAMNATWRPLGEDPAAGIALTYGGGPVCGQFGAPTYTTWQLACDKTVPAGSLAGLALDKSVDGCSLTYSARTASACGSPHVTVLSSLGAGWIGLLSALGAAGVYLGAGVAYNRRVHGASGIEAIPNIDTWRKVGRTLAAGGAAAAGFLTCGRLGGGGGGYDRAGGLSAGGGDYVLTEDDGGATAL